MVAALWIDDGSGPVRAPGLTDEEFEAGLAGLRAANLEACWRAARDYECQSISGSAIGLVTLGVLAGKPKCQAVQQWIAGIWALYYQRKPLVSYMHDQSLSDFSACGSMPHTVPELIAEVMG